MKNQRDESSWQLETKLVRSGTERSNFGEVSEALFLNSGFCYDSAETAEKRFNKEEPGYVYSRYLNPTLAMLEKRLCAIEEGAEACCVMASGMAAVFGALMSQLKTGDHVAASKVLFGSCHHIITQLLPQYGIEYTLVDGSDLDAWEQALRPETKAVFIETPANPTLQLTDIAEVSKLAHKVGASVIVDNVFATPLGQAPLTLGADIVVYSTTKHLDGQGRTLGGAVLGSAEFIEETLLPFHRHTGPALSPFNAWVILKGLETLALRIERHNENAQKIAEVLEEHSKVERVFYPGLKNHPHYEIAQKQMKQGGGLVAFEIKGGKKEAFALMNRLAIIDISNNLGDAKSLITHPATTTHSNLEADQRADLGITDGVLRLSAGIENPQDLITDLKQALS